MGKYCLVLLMLLGILSATPSWAELTLLKQETLVDSEEPPARRIASYDFDVTSSGVIHAIYSKPVVNEERTKIVYTTKSVGGEWLSESQRTVLEEYGKVASFSTWVLVDEDTGIVHVCYIVERDFVFNNTTHKTGLIYQTIVNGTPGEKIQVSPGSFHAKMQLNADGQVIFIREYEVFLNEDGTPANAPFPKALRMHIPVAGTTDVWEDEVLSLPDAVDYRVGNYIYDVERNRHHVTYGDQDAIYLRDTYPTTNPSQGSSGVYFPPGSAHTLWHAYSDDMTNTSGNPSASANGNNWTASVIDGSGNLSEGEFWTDLILDHNGVPYSANYRYGTDSSGIHNGTTNVIGNLVNGEWNIKTVAGKTTGLSPTRAGMGTKILIDKAGRFHGVWDNSPDTPIDGENPPPYGDDGAGGTTMYRFSADGKNWGTRQLLLNFSAEGQCRAMVHDDKLLLMVLGDHRDTKVVFAEYQMPGSDDDIFEVSSDKMFYSAGETIKLHARLQGDGTTVGDIYVVVAGPFNVNSNTGALQPVSATFQYYYLNSGSWNTFELSQLSQIQPVLQDFSLIEFYDDFMFPVAKSTTPFKYSARYLIYSVLNKPNVSVGALLTPLHTYELHVW